MRDWRRSVGGSDNRSPKPDCNNEEGPLTMKTLLLPAFLALPLAACGIADHYIEKGKVDDAHDAYIRCLEGSNNDPSKCTALKEAWEADKAAFEAR